MVVTIYMMPDGHGSTTTDDAAARGWDNPQMLLYHDREWGVPIKSDTRLFGKLVLDGFQAGLSWAKPSANAKPSYTRSTASRSSRKARALPIAASIFWRLRTIPASARSLRRFVPS